MYDSSSQARGVLKKELLAQLRTTRAMRRSHHASLKRSRQGKVKNAVSISSTGPRNNLDMWQLG